MSQSVSLPDLPQDDALAIAEDQPAPILSQLPHLQFLPETLQVLAKAHLRDCRQFETYRKIPAPNTSGRVNWERTKEMLVSTTMKLYGLDRTIDSEPERWAKPAKVIEVKPIRRLVKSNTIVYGYRGHPSRCIELECGHFHFNRWDAYGCREKKLIPGKSKMICWDCNSVNHHHTRKGKHHDNKNSIAANRIRA